MRLKNFGLKNFKSYGNNRQDINLSENGAVNLLIGRNGSGKTSLLQSIDFTFYRKVKGRNKKYISLSKIPNRLNKNLISDATIILDDSTEVKIVNGLSPDISEVYVNGVLDEKSSYSDYVNVSIDTFKSLVSVKFTDFVDFMSLSSDEKKMLISKLCDLEYFNNLSSKLPIIVRDNKEKLEKTEYKIKAIEKNMNILNDTLIKVSQKPVNSEALNLADIEANINSVSNEISINTDKIEKFNLNKDKLNKYLTSLSLKRNEFKNKVSTDTEKLNLFKSGVCAYCDTNLTEQHNHHDIVETLSKDIESYKLKISELNTAGKAKSELLNKVNMALNKTNFDISVLNKKLNTLHIQLGTTQSKKSDNNDEVISDINSKLESLSNEKNILDIERKKYIDVTNVHKKMQMVLGEDGIKKQIISKLIDPVNTYIQEYIEKLDLPFSLYLDENLDATINNNGYDIDCDTLSDGESRLLNLVIMLSYIKMTRKNVDFNILFLDEVFIFIDSIYIDKVIEIIREFSYEYKLNTYLVHHSPLLDMGKFDNIIYIKKDYFSEIQYGHQEELL